MFHSTLNSSSAKQQQNDLNISQMSSIGTPLDQSTPAFLFGKRKSTAPAAFTNSPLSTASAPSSDIFAYPGQGNSGNNVPQHVKEVPKSVHWSPALVQSERQGTPTGQNNSIQSLSLSHSASKPIAPPSSFTGQALNAPPLRSLRDKIEPAKKVARRNTFAARSTTLTPTTPRTLRNDSHQTQQQPIPEATEDAADTWVTVFGFAPNQVSTLLNLFSRHGEVVSHQAPTNGNFMHVRYSCVTHAHQALSRNGTLLDQNTYIGVVPCTNKDVINGSASGIVMRSAPTATANRSISLYHSLIEDGAENESFNQQNENSLLNVSAANFEAANQSLNSSRISVRSGVGMRPLAADQRANATTAQPKSDGLLNKFWNTIGL